MVILCRRLLELMWTATLVRVLGMQLATISFVVVHLGTLTVSAYIIYMLISYDTDIAAFEVAACLHTNTMM